MPVTVLPVTPDRWGDLAAVFGRRGDDPSWCWCRLFFAGHGVDAPSSPGGGLDNRAALRREVEGAQVPPGLIAYVDGVPVGWSRVGPRRAFPRVTGSRTLSRVLPDDPGAWWVTCFAVDSRHRGTGVGAALLAADVELARGHAATAVEGHPVDVAALTAGRASGASLYTGTMTMFVAADFTEIGRTYPSRPVMRRLL